MVLAALLAELENPPASAANFCNRQMRPLLYAPRADIPVANKPQAPKRVRRLVEFMAPRRVSRTLATELDSSKGLQRKQAETQARSVRGFEHLDAARHSALRRKDVKWNHGLCSVLERSPSGSHFAAYHDARGILNCLLGSKLIHSKSRQLFLDYFVCDRQIGFAAQRSLVFPCGILPRRAGNPSIAECAESNANECDRAKRKSTPRNQRKPQLWKNATLIDAQSLAVNLRDRVTRPRPKCIFSARASPLIIGAA